MATAGSIIADAMYEIGAYAPGDTISSVHQQLGLLRFQNQLNAWQADFLTLNLQTPKTYTLVAADNEFTVGPTSVDVTTTQRPVFIEGINYLNPGSSPATEVPMGEMDDDTYRALSQKTLTSSLPQQYHVNATMPNVTVFVWPTVTQNVGLVLYLKQGITEPTLLTTSVTGPQGYQEAFMYQLALRLCGPMSRPVTEHISSMAAASYARMKRPNEQPAILGVDAALVPTYGGAFNILTGTTSGSQGR